ncbi:hypothetical protein D3C85_781240 [compost metagenome]
MSGMEWVCPHCRQHQAVTENRSAGFDEFFHADAGALGPIGLSAKAIVCANAECRLPTIDVWLSPYALNIHGSPIGPRRDKVLSRRLMPESSSKPQPDYVPKAIRDDYHEACLIRDLSPKASATLARRCLQGMIRDFGKVKPSNLFNEIGALEKAVEEGNAPRGVSVDSIEALTALRKVGNIGAHMEADVNVIVDVDPEEAQVLIDLIESLIDDWYIARHKRQQRFSKAVALGASKTAALADAKAGQAALPAPAGDA